MPDQSVIHRTAPRIVIQAIGVGLVMLLSTPAGASASVSPAWHPRGDEPNSDLDGWRDRVQPVLTNLWQFVKCAGELGTDRPIEDQLIDVSKCIVANTPLGPLAPGQQEQILREVHDLQDLLIAAPPQVSLGVVRQLQEALFTLEESLLNPDPRRT